MSNRREKIRTAADAIAKDMADQGRLIEGGWLSMSHMAYPDGMVPMQEQQLRQAFFCGAQHLYGTMMSIMDEDKEPTDQDMKRMALIDAELESFLHEFMHRHNITDPDIGPKKPAQTN